MDEQNSVGHSETDQYHKSLLILGGLFIAMLFIGIMFYISFRVQSAPAEEETELPALPTAIPTQVIDTAELIGKVIWDVPIKRVAPSTEQEIKAAFATYKPNIDDTNRLAVVDIQISKASENYGAASMAVRDRNNKNTLVDGFEFLLIKTGNTWQITTTGGEAFCNLLRTYPEDMLETRREHYIGCFPESY